MRIEIRLAAADDRTALCELFFLCFGDEVAYTEWYLDNRNPQDQSWVLCEDGRGAAMLTVMPLTVKGARSVYLYGVGTHPLYRGKGYMQMLCQAVFDRLAEQGVAFCLLTPADGRLEQTYHRMGFEAFCRRRHTCVAAKQGLPMHPLEAGEFVEHHRRYLQRHACAAQWPEATLRYLYDEMRRAGGGAVWYESGGQICHAVYTVAGQTVHLLEDSGTSHSQTAAALAAYIGVSGGAVRTAADQAGAQPVMIRGLARQPLPDGGYMAFLLDI